MCVCVCVKHFVKILLIQVTPANDHTHRGAALHSATDTPAQQYGDGGGLHHVLNTTQQYLSQRD